MSELSIFAFAVVRHAFSIISIYKMNYRTDVGNLRERLLGRGAYFENLTFCRGAY